MSAQNLQRLPSGPVRVLFVRAQGAALPDVTPGKLSQPAVPISTGVAWPGTSAQVECDFVVAGLPNEILPCRHARARRAIRSGLEVWQLPKAVVTYRTTGAVVSVVCLECLVEAEFDSLNRR